MPACSIQLHFLFEVYTRGVHGKIGCPSICDLVDASCAVPGLRPRNGGGCAPCELSAGGATFNFSLWKVITVCHLMLEKLESSGMPRVKGQAGCRICDLFCASLSLASWHWSAREIMARSLEEWLMMRCGDTHWALVKDGIVCCTFGRRWCLPEMQGGSREPHAPFVVLPGE